MLQKTRLFCTKVHFGRSRSSKVDDFGTNRKCICDFLLVGHCDYSPILHRFWDLTAFTCSWPHPYSTLNLGVFALHQITHVGVTKRTGLKLFGREIIFEVFQPMWKSYLNITVRQTDRRTDGRTTYCRITALCIASRGKNCYIVMCGLIAFPLIPKQTTLNNYEWPFYAKLWSELE